MLWGSERIIRGRIISFNSPSGVQTNGNLDIGTIVGLSAAKKVDLFPKNL